jgi:hypothetical protein
MQDKGVALIDDVQAIIDMVAGAIGKGVLKADVYAMIDNHVFQAEFDYALSAKHTSALQKTIKTIYDISVEVSTEDSV